ncbi:baseplate J/gp47 family protein [Marinobacter sp. OP 3.4]|uniref:baseplate J/gp47 family protein n=1 Tax=Marinobacter sp. OP 3.4 TaxID=3076501 RepID=UPI002E2310D8
MPFERPSLSDLQERIRADIRARLPGAQPELRRSLLGVLADIEAGGIHGLYGYLDFLSKQLFPDTAESEYLQRWARIWRVPAVDPTAAKGDVTFAGNECRDITKGTRLQAKSGAEYLTDEAVTIVGGTATVSVTATETGEAGNLDAGTELEIVSSLSGVEGTATVGAEGLTGGADPETEERLRERLLARIQRPPHGGSRDDYIQWALEGHPDVTRAWVYPSELENGSVTTRIMTDEATADGTPTTEVVDAVLAYIESVRPVASVPYVIAPVAVPLDLQITITPDTQTVRDRIELAVRDFLRRETEPGSTIYLSQLSGIIYVAAGESRHTLVSPAADITHQTNEIATPGVFTWTA